MKVSLRVSDDPLETIEVETSEDVAATINQSYREEDNLARKWRYHNYSYDVIGTSHDDDSEWYEGMEYAAPDTPESLMEDAETEAESSAWCKQALALLTDVQRNRFLMYASGLSTHEIARREGSNQKSVHKSIEAARKKLKNFYSGTPSN